MHHLTCSACNAHVDTCTAQLWPAVCCSVDCQILSAVHLLAENPKNVVVVSSGATIDKLAATFSGDNLWLAAENGAYVRPPRALWDKFGIEEGGHEWICLYENLNFSWVNSVEQVRRRRCGESCRADAAAGSETHDVQLSQLWQSPSGARCRERASCALRSQSAT
jgi:Trehalose-phosphatase